MKNTRVLQLALLGVIGLAACGGSDNNNSTALQLPVGGGTPPVLPACTPALYMITLSSSSALARDEPQIMQLLVNCGGNVVVVPNVAVDWTVTSGGGTVNGSTTTRTTTASDGASEVTWRFGSVAEVQTIEARLSDVTPPLHAALSRTVLVAGANPCEAAGGTNLGDRRTISADENWTKARSPYFSQCPPFMACAGEVAVTNGAVLTVEPGVAVCVSKVRAVDGGRIHAVGTAAERIHFGLRSRSSQWEGMFLEPPGGGRVISGASEFRHVVIENAARIDVSTHPLIIEDTVVRRDPAVSKRPELWGGSVGGCATFTMSQHTLVGIAPSRIARTIFDGMGSAATPWDYGYGCPALLIEISDQTPPLAVSTRVINSWGPGIGMSVRGAARSVAQTRLTDCEVSGSAEVGIFVDAEALADSLPVITACNIFGNASTGISAFSPTWKLDARGNWWGDPEGPLGRQGDGIVGVVDTSSPRATPVDLGY